MMTLEKIRIGLIPIGEVSEMIPKVLAAHILGYLNLDAEVLPPLKHPAYAHNKKRMQYDAAVILKAMESEPLNDYHKVLGIVDLDIFVPIVTYVFGEARKGGRYGLVSAYRLKKNSDGSPSPMPLLLERAAKVALHELVHLFDLSHCMDARCLMHYSGELEELDKTPLYFCRYCSVYLRDALSASNRQKNQSFTTLPSGETFEP
jgi:archaemetzincin